MPQQQWGVPSQPQPRAAQGWPQASMQVMTGQPPAMSYPPAENPWQKPPAGFGGGGQAPQPVWQQPQPAMPQFRPLEQRQGQGSEYRSAGVPALAPYDRPIGSSQDRPQQPGWPGYYPGGAGYPGYSGYPGYPGPLPGYGGAMPAPWGVPGMPGAGPGW